MKAWNKVIARMILEKFGENVYSMIDCHDMFGCMTVIYSKTPLIKEMSNIYHDSVKCGIINKLGNHGAIVMRIDI